VALFITNTKSLKCAVPLKEHLVPLIKKTPLSVVEAKKQKRFQ
jgi:hypothetical protein